jgi:hypothetical protein
MIRLKMRAPPGRPHSNFQAVAETARRRRIVAPTAPKPTIISAQLEGSGTAAIRLTPSRKEIGGAPARRALGEEAEHLRRCRRGEGHLLGLPRADAGFRKREERGKLGLIAERDLPLLRGRAGEAELLAGRLIEVEHILLADRQAGDALEDRARIAGIAIAFDEVAAVRAGRREGAIDRQILAGIVGGAGKSMNVRFWPPLQPATLPWKVDLSATDTVSNEPLVTRLTAAEAGAAAATRASEAPSRNARMTVISPSIKR